VIRHFGPRHAFWLEIAALAGFALSALNLAGGGGGDARSGYGAWMRPRKARAGCMIDCLPRFANAAERIRDEDYGDGSRQSRFTIQSAFSIEHLNPVGGGMPVSRFHKSLDLECIRG